MQNAEKCSQITYVGQSYTDLAPLTIDSDTKLGLVILPPEVRLHPNTEDGYQWSVLPQAQHLFRQNLSKLTTREYIQIMQGIDITFEAKPYCPTAAPLLGAEPVVPPETFTSSIEMLSNQIKHLQQDADLMTQSLESERRVREKLEMDLKKTQAAYTLIRQENAKAQHISRRLVHNNRSLRAKLHISDNDFREIRQLVRRFETRADENL